MRTIAQAAAAVNAEFRRDLSLPVMYPYGLGRTVFNAVYTADAGIFV